MRNAVMRAGACAHAAALVLVLALGGAPAPAWAAGAESAPAESMPATGPASLPGVAPAPPDEETDLGDPGYVLERIDVRGNHKTTTALIESLLPPRIRPGQPWDERAGRLA